MKTFLTIAFCICLTALAGDLPQIQGTVGQLEATDQRLRQMQQTNAADFPLHHRPHVFNLATNDPAWSAHNDAEAKRDADARAYARIHSSTNSLTWQRESTNAP